MEGGFIEDAFSKVIESNEIPYIIPRIILGGCLLGAIAFLAHTPTFDMILPRSISVFLVVAVGLVSWLVGYLIDTLSLIIIRSVLKFDDANFGFFYKVASGYRMLLISSVNVAVVAYLICAIFIFLVLPKFDQTAVFGFNFWFSIFGATCLLCITGMYIAAAMKGIRTDLERFRDGHLRSMEHLVAEKVAKAEEVHAAKVRFLERELQEAKDKSKKLAQELSLLRATPVKFGFFRK